MNTPCKTLTILYNHLIVKKGSSTSLNPIITPSSATNKILNYTSSNPTCVSISAQGVIQALQQGYANITITTTDKTNLYVLVNIQVINHFTRVTGIGINRIRYTMKLNTHLELLAYIQPTNATNQSIIWTKSNNNVNINNNGLVTALQAGTTIITATSLDNSNYHATCEIISQN